MLTSLPWWQSERFKATLLSVLILAVMLGVWHLATLPKQVVSSQAAPKLTPEQLEYAKLMGK
ncbi:MAG: hypothetical protein RJB60_2111, partial [Pseudomonadota bacterium]